MRKYTKTLVMACAVAGIASAAFGQSMDEQIAVAKAATEKYKDVNVALADGYVPDPSGHCISAGGEGLPAELGAMGIHYLNMGLLKITTGEPRVDGESTHTDFTKPAVLLYEPQMNGSLELVGIENLVFQKAWKAAGNMEPPKFADRVWGTMADNPDTKGDEAHGFQPHYDLHVWAFRENPTGITTSFNPSVTCKHHNM